MRLTSKTCVSVVALTVWCAGLLAAFSNPVSSQEAKKGNPRIKELQQKRLTVLEQRLEIASRLYSSARLSYEEVHTASAELLTAQLDYAAKREDRIKFCDEAIKKAVEWKEIAQQRKESAQGTMVSVLKAEADILELQITREKLESE